jgi:DNA-binding MarR family transcriptional regulator
MAEAAHMSIPTSSNGIYEFLSAARVFAKAVRDVIEGAVLEGVAGTKLTLTQLKLLYLVANAESVTIGEAARFLGVSSPAASKTVEKLVRRRLLRRNDTQRDRRSSNLSLTESGSRLLQSYEEARNQKAIEIFSQYSPDVLRHTAELLDNLACVIASQQSNKPKDDLCMQCEIYFRENCRFGQFGARKCFYQLHRNNLQDTSASSAAVPKEEPNNEKEEA